MKRFEEQYTAWIDGKLSESERSQLEQGLAEGLATAETDRSEALQLGMLLRTHYDAKATAPAFKNEAFFNESIRQQIETDIAKNRKSSATSGNAIPWPFWRMLWGGLGSLGLAAILFLSLVLPSLQHPGPPAEYYAQILKTQTSDPTISAVAIHSNEENVTILWIDGLDYVPAKSKN